MVIHFATWLVEKAQGNALSNRNARTRLLSYHFIMQENVTLPQLTEYVKTGRLDLRKEKLTKNNKANEN